MPARVTLTYLKAQRDAAFAARARLVQQFINAGRTPDQAKAIVDRHCARGGAETLPQSAASDKG